MWTGLNQNQQVKYFQKLLLLINNQDLMVRHLWETSFHGRGEFYQNTSACLLSLNTAREKYLKYCI